MTSEADSLFEVGVFPQSLLEKTNNDVHCKISPKFLLFGIRNTKYKLSEDSTTDEKIIHIAVCASDTS